MDGTKGVVSVAVLVGAGLYYAYSQGVLASLLRPARKSLKDVTLDDVDYHYDDQGELRHVETGERFAFVDQAHYEYVSAAVTRYVQETMKEKFHVLEVPVPVNAGPSEATNNVFLSKDFFTNRDKLLVVIQGSGPVRPGVWSRSLCINDNLSTGTIFPYLTQAEKDGYAYIILNPNDNTRDGKPIRGSETPQSHTVSVWDQYVLQSPAKDVAIIAHSYGGVCTMELLMWRVDITQERLRAVALTDSVRDPRVNSNLPAPTKDFLRSNCINFVASKLPLDTPIERGEVFTEVSAGHDRHEMTNASSIRSVFAFVNERMSISSSSSTATTSM